MAPIIDFHAHVIPDPLDKVLPRVSKGPLKKVITAEKISFLRRQARSWLRPISGSMHKAQTAIRVFPESARKTLDAISGFAPIPNLLVESTPNDLSEAMNEAGIDYSAVIAHPPLVTNEVVLELARKNFRIIPVVYIAKGTPKPGVELRKLIEQGARAVKIHPAADGEGVGSTRYKAILKVANELKFPVILHTGCLHTHLLYKDPEMGHVERFRTWFETYKDVPFILAHMNFHNPQVALDLAETFPNLFVDTSWQPAEMIAEAVRRIGPERVLFGTDWPFVGNNLSVGLSRIRDCVEAGLLKESDAKLILGENAARLLKLNT